MKLKLSLAKVVLKFADIRSLEAVESESEYRESFREEQQTKAEVGLFVRGPEKLRPVVLARISLSVAWNWFRSEVLAPSIDLFGWVYISWLRSWQRRASFRLSKILLLRGEAEVSFGAY